MEYARFTINTKILTIFQQSFKYNKTNQPVSNLRPYYYYSNILNTKPLKNALLFRTYVVDKRGNVARAC